MIVKRTFEAAQYPKGSPERARLNENVSTSEYSKSQKYLFFTERWGYQTYKTLPEALEAEELYTRSMLDV